MSRARWIVAMIALAACAKREPSVAFRPLDVGMSVPAYAMVALTGDSVRLGGAQPPTILNVWATWCTSCVEEMAALDSLRREFGAREVRVIGVSVDDSDIQLVRRFTESHHLGFVVTHDPAGDIQRRYKLVAVPTTFVIDGDGKLAWRHTGNIDGMLDSVRTVVAAAAARRK